MTEWTQEQERRIRQGLGVEPDVLRPVIQAFNALLHGDAVRFRRAIAMATTADAINSLHGTTAPGDDQVTRCRAICIVHISERWGIPPEAVQWRLNRVLSGDEEPPTHLLDEEG